MYARSGAIAGFGEMLCWTAPAFVKDVTHLQYFLNTFVDHGSEPDLPSVGYDKLHIGGVYDRSTHEALLDWTRWYKDAVRPWGVDGADAVIHMWEIPDTTVIDTDGPKTVAPMLMSTAQILPKRTLLPLTEVEVSACQQAFEEWDAAGRPEAGADREVCEDTGGGGGGGGGDGGGGDGGGGGGTVTPHPPISRESSRSTVGWTAFGILAVAAGLVVVYYASRKSRLPEDAP